MGSNLGKRRQTLQGAVAAIEALDGAAVIARSPLYETEPVGPPQPSYLNAALSLRWEHEPEPLLDALLAIERQFGRERRERWGARTLDLDILWWEGGPVRTERLRVPHPELIRRAFALGPLLDVAEDLGGLYDTVLAGLGGRPPLAVPGW